MCSASLYSAVFAIDVAHSDALHITLLPAFESRRQYIPAVGQVRASIFLPTIYLELFFIRSTPINARQVFDWPSWSVLQPEKLPLRVAPQEARHRIA